MIQNLVQGNNLGFIRFFDYAFKNINYENSFQKESILHQFTYFFIREVFYEDIQEVIYEKGEKCKDSDFLVCGVLDYYDIERDTLEYWLNEKQFEEHRYEYIEDTIMTYFNEWIINEIDRVINQLATEVFHVLFLNRTFLYNFNLLVADSFTKNIDGEDIRLQKKGYFKRVSTPSWVKRTVFFRDRGVCVFCPSNLSGIIDSLPKENFDHIVPLSMGGLNDVSNIQLTCESCNKSKQSEASTSDIYRRMYKKE